MTIANLVKTDYDGTGISRSHVPEFLDLIDEIITQVNTNASGLELAVADIETAEAALDQTDDYIRGDVDFALMGTTNYTEVFDVTDVTGTGTNVISGGVAALATSGAANDRESSLGVKGIFSRGDRCRSNWNCLDDSSVKARFGMYNASTRYMLVTLDTSRDGNLYFEINDGTGAETEDLGIAVVGGDDKDITIWSDADGTPHVAIDGTEIVLTTITNKMHTNAHKYFWDVETLTTAARELTVSWLKYKRAV